MQEPTDLGEGAPVDDEVEAICNCEGQRAAALRISVTLGG
jgi:hypothetical protein